MAEGRVPLVLVVSLWPNPDRLEEFFTFERKANRIIQAHGGAIPLTSYLSLYYSLPVGGEVLGLAWPSVRRCRLVSSGVQGYHPPEIH